MATCVNVHKRSVDEERGVLEGHPNLSAKQGIHYGICGAPLKGGGGVCAYTSNKPWRSCCKECGALPPPEVMAEQARVQRELKAAGSPFGGPPYRKPIPAPDLVGGQGHGKGAGKGGKGKGKGKGKQKVDASKGGGKGGGAAAGGGRGASAFTKLQ